MVGDVKDLSVICSSSSSIVGDVVQTRGDQVGIVSLPQTNVNVQGRGKSRDLHVVCPFSRLAHLLDVVFELFLQLGLGVEARIDASLFGSSSRLAFWVSADIVARHVLAVEVCILLHVLDGGDAKHVVHFLVAVQLVREGVE